MMSIFIKKSNADITVTTWENIKQCVHKDFTQVEALQSSNKSSMDGFTLSKHPRYFG